jgi:tetratricopeptide (TPR) repeat protein
MDSRRTARRRTRAATPTEPAPSAPGPTDLSSRGFAYAVLGVLLLTALVHAPAFGNPFLFFDDPQNVLENPPIRALTADNVKIYFTTPLLGMYSPLVYLSYAIDYRIGAFDTTAYHATNLTLHLLNVVLVGAVARRLSGHAVTGVLVALLFGVHPLNLAGVTPLSVRSSLLYSVFYLAAYLAYLAYTRRQQPRWLAAALGCFVLAGLSKSAAIVFPALLLLTDFYLGRRVTRGVWLEKLPFFLISLVFGALAVAFRSDMGGTPVFSLDERIWLALYSLAYYVVKLIVPIGLSPFHPYPARVDGRLPLMVYAAPLALAAAVAIAWWWKSQRRLLAFGGAFFLLNIVLVLKIVPLGVEFMADRYVYLPSVGFLLVAVELCRAGAPAFPRRAVVALAAVALWFSAASYMRATDWRDRLTFETRVLERYPDDPDALAGLGIALADQGRLEEAVVQFSRAVVLDPGNADTHVNLGAALQKLGRFEDAMRAGREATRLRPQQAGARTNLAAALEALGRLDEAAVEYAEVVRLTPTSGEAHANLGRILLALKGRTSDAVAELREALRLGAAPGSTRYLLGSALAELERLPEAVAEYEAALKDESMARSPELHNDLGVVLGRLGRVDAAVAEFKEALRLDPTFEAAKANLAKSGR